MSKHAKAAPSSAHRWLNCLGSIAQSGATGEEDTSSSYADEGTHAHGYAAYRLADDLSLPVVAPLDDDMESFVAVYVDAVRRAAIGKLLYVEMPIDISRFTGEPDAKGTSDAVVVGMDTLEVHDLKYGEGVIVYAEHNEQLMLYALGVLEIVGAVVDIENIKLVIHQPRRDHLSEWTINVADLLLFGAEVRKKAAIALTCNPGEHLNPSAESCQWCPAKATCPALRELVFDNVMRDFDGVDVVVEQMPANTADCEFPTPGVLAMIEGWVGAIKKAIFEKLGRFEPVPGWKLVLGRPGNRKWKDAEAVEELLKSLRVTKGDSHEQNLKSPTQLEKAGLSPKKWAQVESHISRSDAKPIMVGENDPKPAIEQAKADEFEMFR